MIDSTTVRARFPRYDVVDALRGAAMVWMTVFHFCFDLSHLGLWRQNFLVDPFWTNQRVLIVSLFLFCAGLGQSIAWAQGQAWGRFCKRWLQIVAAALLVSAGSYVMFPQSYIYFGVLHGIAAMLLIVRLTSSWGHWLWLTGLLAVLSPWVAQMWLGGAGEDWAALMNGRSLNWLGWITQKPFTEDYVPIFPWLGVMWWGMAAGQWLQRVHSTWLKAKLPAGTQWLALMGRWSLSYYLLHQPILMGILSAFVWLTKR
ncbi:DUF1624 domain-containing protein [Diaphorobacter sp. HDW4A]|uniref:DUF1624 domain-containing protein n=1 Tax=Diaphorobacter sp. HDW4A TaxID=2714924 RepID=UPI00140ADE4A|nr:heparan-alpha-glucosaminide N-acetyltransferase [Diaphorobacter sp. HDW4A]QIL79483.1 DUF1624 domain-containing protein [Diaphorobacter sp. HDW4A]